MGIYQEFRDLRNDPEVRANPDRGRDVNGKVLYNKFKEKFRVYQKNILAPRFYKLCEEQQVSDSDLARLLDLHLSYITAARRQAYRLTIETTARICKDVFHMSIFEFLWDELPPPVTLPKDLGLVAEYMDSLTLPEQKRLSSWAAVLAKMEMPEMDPVESSKPLQEIEGKPVDVVFRTRYAERINDIFCSWGEGLGEAYCTTLNHQDFMKPIAGEEDYTREPRFTIPMTFISIENNIPIDYFAVQDYTIHCDIAYKNKAGEHVRVKSPYIKALISFILNSPQDLQAYIIGQTLAHTIR